MSAANEPPTDQEVAALLADIDQVKANELMAAFDQAAKRNQADMGAAMWAIAMLQARVVATAPMGDVQIWTATRMGELARIALPFMMLVLEKARRAAEGERPFDG